AVVVGHGTMLHVLAGSTAQLLDVADERSRLDHEWLLIVLGHGVLLSRTWNTCSLDARPAARPRPMATLIPACGPGEPARIYLAILTRRTHGHRRGPLKLSAATGTHLATDGPGRTSQKEGHR